MAHPDRSGINDGYTGTLPKTAKPKEDHHWQEGFLLKFYKAVIRNRRRKILFAMLLYLMNVNVLRSR